MSRCSFCGQSADVVDYLVTGPRGVAICDECAALAHQVASEALRPVGDDLLLMGAGQVVTCDERRGVETATVHRGAVAIRRGRVTWVGPEPELPARYRQLPVLDCDGRAVCPGLVDASNRLLVDPADGHRPDPDELAAEVGGHLEAMLARGVTAVDLRAGGSPDPAVDTTLLAVARAVGEKLPLTVSVTWEVGPMPLRLVGATMGPTAARLASTVLVRCDGGGSAARTAASLDGALPLRVATCPSGADDCGEIAAVGVEGPGQMMASTSRPPVLEAAAALEGGAFPVAERWRAAGGCAVATGSHRRLRLLGMGIAAGLAATVGGLSPSQALWSISRGGAQALGDPERGRIRAGGPGDVVVLDTDDPLELLHRPDADLAWRVVAGGVICVE